MKKSVIIVFALLSFSLFQAQEITTIVDIDFPLGITVHNDDIYIGGLFDGRVKASLGGTFPAPYSVIDPGFMECSDLIVHNDNLYIAQLDGGNIFQIDLTVEPLTRTLFTATDGLNGFALKDNYLYFSTSFDGKIQRINLNAETIVIETVLSGLARVSGIAISGDELYFCESNTDNVSKINLTESNPTPVQLVPTGIIDNPTNIAVDVTTIYVSEISQGRISKIDLTDANSVTRVLTGLSSPRDIDIANEYLYISESGADRILRVALSDLESLSIEEVELTNTLKIFPNPSNNFIQIEGLQNKQAYTIYDIQGKKITNDFLRANEKINIQKLQNGMYFLKLENEGILKFMKR